MKDSVSFRGFFIQHLELRKKEEKEQKKFKDNKMEINSHIFEEANNPNLYRVEFVVNAETVNDVVEITLIGIFEFNENLPTEIKDDFLRRGAPRELYPYVRAALSTITSLDSESAILLPIIDFDNMEPSE